MTRRFASIAGQPTATNIQTSRAAPAATASSRPIRLGNGAAGREGPAVSMLRSGENARDRSDRPGGGLQQDLELLGERKTHVLLDRFELLDLGDAQLFSSVAD